MKISSKFSLALLAGTILSTPATAAEEKEITVDYLNSLTGPKVTWSETEGDYKINLAGKTWYYDYNKPEGYDYAAGHIEGTFDQDDVTNVVFNLSSSYSGAIDSVGDNGNIIADFIGNHSSGSGDADGGAIHNGGSIGSITGDFIGNHTDTAASYYGGAINGGTIESIAGNFIGNFSAYGGAISNSTIENITGNFIGNSAAFAGGAIHNSIYNSSATIGNITGNFIGNYVQSDRGNAFGGAIYNEPKVTIKTNLPDNPIYHLTIKYGNEEAEIYTLPQGSELSANIQMISGTLTVNSEYYFNRYKNQDIRAPLTSMLPQLQEEYAQLLLNTCL